MLEQLDDLLDGIHTAWTRMLVENLDDPTVRANLELLKPKDRTLVAEFRERGRFRRRSRRTWYGALQGRFGAGEGDDSGRGSAACPDGKRVGVFGG